MSVSLLGDGIFLVAIAWQAYGLLDRPAALAYVGVAISLPQVILLLVGGATSDRVPRQTILLYADVSRALAVGALALATATDHVRLWELYVVGALIGSATAFASPAFDAIVPQLVPAEELNQANSFEQFVRPVSLQLAGPALGGLAVATVHPAGALILDAVTFAFSACCVWRMPRLSTPVHPTAPGNLHREIREGLRYVRRHVWLWGTFLSATFTYLLFIGPTQVLLPYIVRNAIHQGPSTYGLILTAGGIGALFAAVVMGRRGECRRPIVWIYGWWAVATLGVAGYGVATQAWGLALAAIVVNGAEVLGAVVWATLKQRR
ncbi:MAG TPA: MFS transporter, partial [Acidimicrobiales bacterium]|nr:MFS transporter [Acidimicrobiales bacterium]